jgi:hypothetical protein
VGSLVDYGSVGVCTILVMYSLERLYVVHYIGIFFSSFEKLEGVVLYCIEYSTIECDVL